ncbi:MAG: hypothetical protein CVU47_00735 [Chloroflexi bacterium HGW-Chloroflexi-9]|nr:MAG: hypothetical protein CVU47_00735 [Chloroflexi bacterium HGW-Chloroflexi-9]
MQRWLSDRIYYGWVMVACALAINAVSSTVNPVIFSFMIGPMAEDLGIPRSELAWSFTLRLVAAGLVGPLLGVMIDRHGTRWIGAGSGLLVGVMLILLARSHDLWIIYLVFAVSGLAGLGGPSGQLLTQVPLAKWFVAKRGRALAIGTMGMAAGTTCAIPITQWLVEHHGWRTTNVLFGIVVMAVVVPVCAIFVRRNPEDIGLFPDGADGPPSEAVDQSPRLRALTTTEDWTVREAMRTRSMWLLLTALGLSGVVLTGTLVYRVDFWRDTGMSSGLVAFGTTLDPLTVVFSVFAFGMVADRLPVRYLGFVGLAGLALSVLPMVLTGGQGYTIVLHNVIWGASAGGFITLNNLVWPNYFGRQFLGAIRGVVLPVSIAASGIGAPLYGYILDAGVDPRQLWVGSTAGFALSAVLVLLARPPARPVRA